MILPVQFDKNEWFVLIGLVIFYTAVFVLPKRFPLSISILVMLFTLTIARISDHLLSTSDINFYNVMDSGKYELFDVFVYILYGPFGYFLAYFYDKWKLKGMMIQLYVIGGTVVSSCIEFLAVHYHVFDYKGWALPYSFCYYLVMLALTLLFFRFLQNTHPSMKGTNQHSL
ncbi:hypothetical protein [Aquibacillus albus]|uniref:TRAP-type C4-dicarboxylate transport system permease small subunit n=1 Tax=Aquibacillus albus TaxID=1168171 RepID=A0ABS2MY68_9BACI|nr:hypothetical protein [Aquibacillus albus]MBM7570838.1 TRAP-type C4-dicarboxylate transport system permease small subunit [Aquibacillus albus]